LRISVLLRQEMIYLLSYLIRGLYRDVKHTLYNFLATIVFVHHIY